MTAPQTAPRGAEDFTQAGAASISKLLRDWSGEKFKFGFLNADLKKAAGWIDGLAAQNSALNDALLDCQAVISAELEGKYGELLKRVAAALLPARESEWQPIASAPTNLRIIVQANSNGVDECAMAWLDRIDMRFYYAPQGGLLSWKPTEWQNIPAPPTTSVPSNLRGVDDGK